MEPPLRKWFAATICALVLSGCVSHTETLTVDDDPYLIANSIRFDPVAHDVEDESVCDGIPGSEILERFDRANADELEVQPGEALMTCGHPDGAGWRHIADGHTEDFGDIAALVDSSWEDVAWFAIDRALEDPDQISMYRDDIANFIVLLEYVGTSGEVELEWQVVVGVGLTSGKIITSFPRDPR